MTDTADHYVEMFDSLVPVPALRLLWSLEDRGCTFRVHPYEDTFWIDPTALVTDSDRALICRYKPHLVRLLRRCDLTPPP